MAANALFITTLFFLAGAMYLLEVCQFLIPYRSLLWENIGVIMGYAACLYINVAAAIYLLGRKVFLKDTGRKLAHLERQLRTSETLSKELSERLQD